MPQPLASNAPGFLCPACQRVRIRLSIAEFLSSRAVACPDCGTEFHMDKSGCTRMVEMLQDLHIAQKNAELLKGPR